MLGTNLDKHPARLSVLRNKKWMGKKFFRGGNGGIQKQSNGLFTDGIVRSLEVLNSAHLAKLPMENTKSSMYAAIGFPNHW